MKREIWIVEMKVESVWFPTVGCALTNGSAKLALHEWQKRNPDDRFRLRKYRAI